MRSSIYTLLYLYLCSCQYLGVETHKDSATLTRIAKTKYERDIDDINDCLKKGGGKELTEEQRKEMLHKLEKEGDARGDNNVIDPAAYGSICANFVSGTIESQQVRRCRYKLDVYPLALIKECIRAARELAPRLKESVSYNCQQAKAAMDALKEEQIEERQLTRLELYHKLKKNGCDN